MCDEKERTENGKGPFDSGDQGMFDGCASIMKSMFGKCREIMREAPEGSPAEGAGATESAVSTGTPMSKLRFRERELVALGAAMGSNCGPCIEYHVPKAREAGLGDDELREAIRLADKVRNVPARKVLDTALQLLSDDAASTAANPGTPPRSRGAAPPAAEGACCG